MSCNCKNTYNCLPCNTCNSTCSKTCSCKTYNVTECGCPQQIDSKCVFYKGPTTPCLEITTSTNLEDIIEAIDAAICDLSPVSGNIYNVAGVSGQITVVETEVGNTTTFTVGIDSNITNKITNLESAVTTLQTCCDESVKEITTDTPSYLTITDEGSGTWNIDFNPSTTTTFDGIIHSDIVAATTPTGTGADVLVKSFSNNYVANNDIQDGDEIRFYVSGRILGNETVSDSIKIDIYDTTTATLLTSTVFNGFSTASGLISSYFITGSIVVDLTNSAGLLTLNMDRNTQTAGIEGDKGKGMINVDDYFTGTNYTNLTIRVRQVNNSNQTFTNNNVRRLVVEVRKKIV